MITGAFCLSYKEEILRGIHSDADTYKLALFRAATVTLDKTTSTYGVTGELVATGYTAGGLVLVGFNIVFSGDSAGLVFTSPQWTPVSFSAEGALIYNATKASRAVCVLDFGGTITSTNDVFGVTLPSTGILTVS